jgi:hypothetical protein
MRRVTIASLAVLILATLAWATDAWKKPYQQWDKKDVQKILDDSPWAKIVRVPATWEGSMAEPTAPQPQQPQGSAAPSSGAGGGSRPGMGGSGAAGGPPSGGMQSGGVQPAAETPQAAFVVRWLSAHTMREALVRNAVLNGQMNQSQADTQLAQQSTAYQIMITGPQMVPFEQSTEETVKNAALLQLKKSKQKIQPEKVEFQRSPDGSKVTAVIIAFPVTMGGQPTIGPDARGAEFSVTLGRTRIQTSFDFSKMEGAQGRDL